MARSKRVIVIASDQPVPPPLPGVRHLRLPRVGIVVADDELRFRVDRVFHWPMIVLALLVLPLLAIELFYLDKFPEAERNWIGILCWIGFTAIWLAFFVEFVIKVAIAECRVEYCKRNWLDIIIIIVPALRPLRLTSLVRTSRVFKLRGVGMKAFRYALAFIVGLEVADPWLQKIGLKKSKARREPEKMTRFELTDEIKRLRRRNDQWEAWHKAQREYLLQIEREPFDAPAPQDELHDSPPRQADS
jgi:hypothetical protein